MRSVFEIIREINELTLKMEFNYPELYRNMDENLINVQGNISKEIEPKALNDYLLGLREMINRYQQSHPELI